MVPSATWVVVIVISLGLARAQSAANALVVINDNSTDSRSIGDYYARRREMPAGNVCHVRASIEQDIRRATYDREIGAPISQFLKKNALVDRFLYIVTTAGVPLRIEGTSGVGGNEASVDSELTAPAFRSHQKASPIRWVAPSSIRSSRKRASSLAICNFRCIWSHDSRPMMWREGIGRFGSAGCESREVRYRLGR